MSTVRLFLDVPLGVDLAVPLVREQAHYLFNVMRLAAGDEIRVFNGKDGEWRAEIAEAGKKRGLLSLVEQTRPQTQPPDIELLFAPIKKARTDFIVEKACELGCRCIQPVFTQFTNSERLNLQRLRAHMVEAVEQCDGLSVPELKDPEKLRDVLARWSDRLLIFCNEDRSAAEISSELASIPKGTPASILIGPEGGFAPTEIKTIQSLKAALPVSLGPRILRADTAAVAALVVA